MMSPVQGGGVRQPYAEMNNAMFNANESSAKRIRSLSKTSSALIGQPPPDNNILSAKRSDAASVVEGQN